MLAAPGSWAVQLTPDGSLVDPTGRMVVELVEPNDPGNESSAIVDVSEWLGAEPGSPTRRRTT